jgi:hypothetical protein
MTEYQVALIEEMLAALKAVVSVADRKTVEFDQARAAIAKAERHIRPLRPGDDESGRTASRYDPNPEEGEF